MSEEKFNPLFVIGKTRKEAIEYFNKHNIMYNFESCILNSIKLAIYTSHKEGTHFYSIYDYNSNNSDQDIIVNFNGIQGIDLINKFSYPNVVYDNYNFNVVYDTNDKFSIVSDTNDKLTIVPN